MSDEDRLVNFGGEPSDFLERNPAWKRLLFDRRSKDGCGAFGIGDDPAESLFTSAARYDGMEGKIILPSPDETSGVESVFCGVFSKSARAPDSVSSRHRTLLFEGDFFFGVKEIPFLPTAALRRLGEAFMGEENI